MRAAKASADSSTSRRAPDRGTANVGHHGSLTVFVDRRRRSDRFLEWKVRLFSVAAALALVGIYLDERWVAGAAIPVLVVAMLLRFVPGGRTAPGDEDEDGEEHDEGVGERISGDRDREAGPSEDAR